MKFLPSAELVGVVIGTVWMLAGAFMLAGGLGTLIAAGFVIFSLGIAIDLRNHIGSRQ